MIRALPFLLLAGCATLDRPHITQFYPEDGGFRYEAQATLLQYPPTDPDAERQRMEWLAEYLRDNQLCRNGYTITERRPVVTTKSAIGTAYRIDYRGLCK